MSEQIIEKEQVLRNALIEIKRLKKEVELNKSSQQLIEPIAVVGMACRFPGGITSPSEYWNALINQKNMISKVPENRWRNYSKSALNKNPYLQKAGFLSEDIEAFDHRLFRLSPKEVERIDPQQRMFLKVCWEAIENAGYAPDTLKGSKTGVYAGVSAFDHSLKLFGNNKSDTAPEPTDIMGSSFSFISGRASYFFGFQGPGITLDTACSSSLVAVDQACKGLLLGDCDMAIAGGVNLMLSPKITELLASLNVLSPNCEIKSFDAEANGTVRGEGCGIVLLKKLSDAKRDGDHIHALIKGSGTNQDGLSSGLTATYGPAQEKLIRGVWERSKVDSADIDFIETHGTGTELGDPIEIGALSNVISKNRTQPVYLGAVKTAIGHLEAASGIAGFIKTVLSLENKKIPGNLNFKNPSLHIDWATLPIKVPEKTIAWIKEKGARKAGVSSFGLSGTNAHVVLQEYHVNEEQNTTKTLPSEANKKWPFRFSATSNTGLRNQLLCFKEFVEQQVHFSIKNLSYSQNISKAQQKQKLVIWATNRNELIHHLSLALEGKNNADIAIGTHTKKVVFLFSGGGSQYPGMFKDLYTTNPVFKKYLNQCNKIYQKITNHDLLSILFSNNNNVHKMCYTQVSLFAVEYALAKTWISYGVNPTYLLGHSTGEYTAACLDHVFNLEEAIKLITQRGQLMYDLPKGGKMAAVRAKENVLQNTIQKHTDISMAASNTQEQTVISGAGNTIDLVSKQFIAKGLEVKPIQVTHASHSPLMTPMIPSFEEVSKNIQFHSPSGKLISNVTGKIADSKVASYKYWSSHILSPVRFMQSIRSIDSIQNYVFLEVGPGGTLAQMVEIISDEPVDCLVSSYKEENTSSQMEKCLFYLSNCGVDINWKKFYQHSGCEKIFVPNYQFSEQSFTLESPSNIKNILERTNLENIASVIDSKALSQEEQKHLPSIIKALQNGFKKSTKKEESAADFSFTLRSSYDFKQVDEVKQYLKSLLANQWRIKENEIDNDESLLLLGLDSIAVAKLVKRWKDDLIVQLKPAPFFKNPTINGWAKIIFEKIESNEKVISDDIAFVHDPENRYEVFNFTDVQNAYFVGRNPEITWGGYSCYGYLEFNAKNLDVEQFNIALLKLIQRHEMLRCIITKEGNQHILPSLNYSPTVYKHSSISNINKHINDVRNQMVSNDIPLGEPMFKIKLTEKEPNNWCIHFGLDFMIVDALSMSIFWRDLYKLYHCEILPPIEVSFKDYVHYLNKRKEGNTYNLDKQYWLQRIKTFPKPPEIPINASLKHQEFKGFKRREQWFNAKTWSQFVHSATKQNLTPSAALLTIFCEVLSAWGAGEHFGIVLTVFDRDNIHPQINDVIGDFTQLSLLEVNRKNISLKQNGQNLQWQMQEDLAHSSYSAIDVVREINKNSPSGEILYPFVFTSALGVSDEHVGFGDKNMFGEANYMVSQTPQVWLDSQVLTKNGGVCISWDALEEIFPQGLLNDMFGKYIELIYQSIENELFWSQQITDVRPPEQIQIHTKVNQTNYPFKNKLLHEPILVAQKKYQHKTAITYNGLNFTYKQLKKRANQVSELLQNNGLKKGGHVAIQMAKSFDMVAVVLGVVQAGGVYIPIYLDNPIERTEEILKKSETFILFADCHKEFSTNITITQLTKNQIEEVKGKWIPTVVNLDDTAYVIYTSGSTGTPKGVEITHQAASNTINDINNRYGINNHDVVLGISSLSFDLSVYDIFGVLANGGALVVPTEQERMDPKCWKKLSEQSKVTLWNTVPALFELYADYILSNKEQQPDIHIKHIFLSGDWIPLNIHQKMEQAIPNAKLISMGGATEASIWSNYYQVNSIDKKWKSIPYGYPLANQHYHILDEFNRPCPNWVKGRLHIAGKGLAKGYLNQNELTEKSFFIHPELKIRLYNTGDYGRYTEDGAIEFLGRQDDQLKINGYRVEMGEIQEAFKKCNNELEAIVLAIGQKMESKKLIAYVKTNPKTFSENQLKQHLTKYVPPYFIPEKIIAVNEYPQTPNGKIDRKQLIKIFTKQQTLQPTAEQQSSIVSSNHPILKIVSEVFEMPNLKKEDSFSALGVSSMDMIRLANHLESQFSDRPAVGEMIRYNSVDDLMTYYHNKGIEFNQNNHKYTDIDSKFMFYTHEQVNYLKELQLIEDYDKRVAYKKKYTSQRKNINTQYILSLNDDVSFTKNKTYQWRKSHRQFLLAPIPLASFKQYLSLCFRYNVANKKQFNYGSAGGTYPVQMYLSVFKNGVENVQQGTYYFDAYTQELKQLTNNEMISPNKLVFDHEWLKNCAFVIHFVADMEVIFPIYEKRAIQYCYIETGLISQLLENQGTQFNIGSCQLGGYDFEKVKTLFQLSTQHFYLHSLAAGHINFEQEKATTLAASKLDHTIWKDKEELLQSLVKKCEQKEIQLTATKETLKFKAPEGAMTKELQNELKQYKPLLIAYLNHQENKAPQKNLHPAYNPFELTPIQWAFITGRENDFELGNVGAHYYTEIECSQESALKFEPALNRVIQNHEALRTIIHKNGTQQVLTEMPYYQVQENTIESNNTIVEIRKQWSHHKYELGKWPMFHFEMSHLANNRSVIHISVDLLVIDAWSGDLMLSEIFKVIQGQAIEKPQITFKNYIRKEKEWHNNNQYFIKKAEDYWKEKLQNIPPAPALPYKKPFHQIEKPTYKRWKFELPVAEVKALSNKAKFHKLTATAVVCTAFMKILCKWSNNKDLTLNLTLFNRLPVHKDVMHILGDFTNVALVSFIPRAQTSFKEQAEEIQNQLWQVIEHRAKNGLELLREIGKKRPYKAVMPIVFTSLLSGESSDNEENIFPEDLKEVYAISQTPQVAIDHQIYRRGGNYIVNWDVVEEAFDHEQVNNMFEIYKNLLKRLVIEKNWDLIFE